MISPDSARIMYTPGDSGTAESRLENRRLRAAGFPDLSAPDLLAAVDGIASSLAETSNRRGSAGAPDQIVRNRIRD